MLYLARDQVVTVLHAARCSGCFDFKCASARKLLAHLTQCHRGIDCGQRCQQLRTIVSHLANCADSKCLLCAKLANGENISRLPNVSCSLKQSNPSNIGELLKIIIRREESDDDSKENLSNEENTKHHSKKRRFGRDVTNLIRQKLHISMKAA
ncbi:hypothetical protein QR680_010186 [Steinernema hermaphroditum]|uniref:TAZ-type domain-containing protein n=1 Tax=Steinernema hermaphroditum TaxID=289476 RepID=A0AA39IN31_9BILA|nr:hypothetical protein QR680_010186 [Steinernema hermaphroditum]